MTYLMDYIKQNEDLTSINGISGGCLNMCLNMDKRIRKIYVLIMMVLYVSGFDYVLWIYCIEKLLMFLSKRSKR